MNENKNKGSVVLVSLLIFAAIGVGIGIYYFLNNNISDSTIKINNIESNDIVIQDNIQQLQSVKDIDPENIIDDINQLEQEEEEFDQMINDLEELNI